jgi:hypothetical protein
MEGHPWGPGAVAAREAEALADDQAVPAMRQAVHPPDEKRSAVLAEAVEADAVLQPGMLRALQGRVAECRVWVVAAASSVLGAAEAGALRPRWWIGKSVEAAKDPYFTVLRSELYRQSAWICLPNGLARGPHDAQNWPLAGFLPCQLSPQAAPEPKNQPLSLPRRYRNSTVK